MIEFHQPCNAIASDSEEMPCRTTPLQDSTMFMRSSSIIISISLALFAVHHAEGSDGGRTAENAVTPTMLYEGRLQQFSARVKEGPVGLLFLGDSIVDQWPKFGHDTWEKFSSYQPADFGIGQYCTEHELWLITHGALNGIDPKAVVILIGTNNIGNTHGEHPEWVAAGIKAILATVRGKLPNAQILLIGLLPRDVPGSPLREKIEAVNGIIRNYDDGKTIHFLNFGSKYLDANGEIPLDFMPDRLHPNAKGYQIWYDAMLPALQQLMK
jgi:beta-glucosidase